jgi:AcrR family transcriptional regulator
VNAQEEVAPRVGSKGQDTHAAIVKAAEELFAERGYDRTRLEDIAARVGIRRASLVYYYRTKAELYAAVLDRLLGDLLVRYRDVLAGPGPLIDRIRGTADAWARYIEERPALLRIMLRVMADGMAPHAGPFTRRAMPLVQEITSAIAQGQAVEEVGGTVHPLHFMMIISGASAFMLLGGALLAPEMAGKFPEGTDTTRHRGVVSMLAQMLLSADEFVGGLRPAASFAEPKRGLSQ